MDIKDCLNVNKTEQNFNANHNKNEEVKMCYKTEEISHKISTSVRNKDFSCCEDYINKKSNESTYSEIHKLGENVKPLEKNKQSENCENCKETFSSNRQFEEIICEYKKEISFQNKFSELNLKLCELNDSLIHKCEKCNKMFSDKVTLKKHFIDNQCNNFKLYTCDICKENFDEMKKLKRHIIAHLNKFSKCSNCKLNFLNTETNCNQCCIKVKHICQICQKTFSVKTRLQNHLKIHKIKLKCCKCKIILENRETLENHMKKCTEFNEKCNYCTKEFKNSDFLEKHLKSHKADNKCENNLKVLQNSNVADDNSNSHNKLDYECDTCKKKFINLTQLTFHIQNNHKEIEYFCEKCDKKFTNIKDYNSHVNITECKVEQSSTCTICNKVFAKKDYLKKHLYMHSNVLFKCKYCYCVFMKEKNYKKHIEKMNCSKSARNIRLSEFNFKKCRICEMEFEVENFLIDHFKSSHSGEEPHQCFCCSKCVPTFQDLQNHIHEHNIQKYTCNICGKPYTSQEGFRKHRLKHKGAEFKCKFCSSEFLNENRYKIHEKTCKKNPESGNDLSEQIKKNKKKDEKPKQSRQLHWESRIIIKHLRGDPKSAENDWENKNGDLMLFDEPETETNEKGWFDNYYKTEEDEIAFRLKSETEETNNQSNAAVCEMQQKNRVPKKLEDSIEYYNDTFNENESDFSSSESSSGSSEEDVIEDVELPVEYNPKKCRFCVITFDQEYELLHHFIKNHPGEHAHKCPLCEVCSPLFAQLKEHMKTHGIGMDIFNCDNCSKKFRSEKKMKIHNVRCKGMNIEEGKILPVSEETCKKCGKKFHTKFGYKRHRQLCKNKKNKNLTNKKPPIAVKVKEDERNSFENEFPETDNGDLSDREDYPAETDNLKVEENFLKKEEKVLESTNEQPEEKKIKVKDVYLNEPPLDSFPCRLCDKKFQYERGIVMHFKSSHPGHKPLICHICNLHLADKLKEHLKTHGIGEEFICELCGKRFNQKFLSKIHEMWHQGIEYKCNNCKQKFLNKEKMEKHIKENRCSNRQSLMRLPCDICGKSYRSKFGLSKHYIIHTPKELRPVKNRMNCEYCGKWFESNNGLQRHRRIHTGERPFRCRFCPKAFAQEGNCKAHERIHTGESKPRKKKQKAQPSTVQQEPPQQQQPQLIPAVLVSQNSVSSAVEINETTVNPGFINLYIYTAIDSTDAIH